MTIDQVLHLAEVLGLALAGVIGALLLRLLDRVDKKLDEHECFLHKLDKRIVSLESRRTVVR